MSFAKCKPYSLENPPQAPKKKAVRESLAQRRGRLDRIPKLVFPQEEKTFRLPEWRLLGESGHVREKFLRVNPDDIEEIDDWDSLMRLRELYTPASQPHNVFEHAYVQLVAEAIDNRMYCM